MPLIPTKQQQKPDDEEVRNGQPVPAGRGGGGGGGMGGAAPAPVGGAPQQSGGGSFGRFVSLGEYMGANQGQGQRMAGKVNASVAQQGAAAKNEADNLARTYSANIANNGTASVGGRGMDKAMAPQYEKATGSATAAQDRANSLNTFGGVQTNVDQVYRNPNSTRGESLWDTAQTQQGGGSSFAQTQARYGNLQQYLGDQNTRQQGLYDQAKAREDSAAAANSAAASEEERKRRLAEAAAEEERRRQAQKTQMEGNREKAETKNENKRTPARRSVD